MENIICIYGGKSVEHDISIITGIQAIENIDTKKYNVIPVYVTRKGKFVVPNKVKTNKDYIDEIKHYKKISFCLGSPYVKIGSLSCKKIKISCILNCMHGVNGEDGTISALANLCNIPITCPDTLSSSVCMDKIIMKDLFRANNLNCVDYIYFSRDEYKNNKKDVILRCKELGFPLIIKPANLGSSIGIDVAKNLKQLNKAIDIAITYDKRVIVEKCLTNYREINCSVLGDENKCEVSLLEEPSTWKDFLNFEEKYILNKKYDDSRFNVRLDEEVKTKIYEMSKKAFKVFCCKGVIRIDFMLDNDNNIYINEINSIPGSLAFYLWKHKYSYMLLIDRLIEIAKTTQQNLQMNNYSYNSNVLKQNKGLKSNKYS